MDDDEAAFIVEIRWVNSAFPWDRTPMPTLGSAIDHAQTMASDPKVHSAVVTDSRNMVWAQFNLLWSIPEEYR